MLNEVPLPEWDERLEATGVRDIYLSSGYLTSSAILDPGDVTLLEHRSSGGGVVFPILVRSIEGQDGVRDVTTPYGYGGPVGFGDDPDWEAFHAEYDRWCHDHGIVTTFTRFHPRYGNQRHAAPSTRVTALAGTIGWRLDGGRDLIAQLRQNHRRIVRRGVDRKLQVTQTEVDDEGLARFRSLYDRTMDRLGAGEFYRFPDHYWQSLRAGLGSALSLAEIWDEGTSLLAAALLFRSAPWLHYHLGASSDEGRRVGATTGLFMDVARAAQDEGFRVFHLGGGVGGADDSLLGFKLGFDAGGLRESAIGAQIHDMRQYRRLTGSESASGYFPGYRRRV